MSAEKTGTSRAWMIETVLVVSVIYFYVFTEWLFFVTKPSFMSTLSLTGRLRVLWAVPAPFVAAGIALAALCWILTRLFKNRPFGTVCSVIVRIVSAIVLAAAFFLLIDNFTYTLFGFGVRTAAPPSALVYVLVLAALGVFSFRLLGTIKKSLLRPTGYRCAVFITPVMLVLSALAALISSRSGGPLATGGGTGAAQLKGRPFIFLISTDALNAAHMSVYGYHRKTTPFIDQLAGRALVCENCFTNAGTSGASIASMLTGKLPTETKLIYPPEILKGEDAYQHLPGILRGLGYRNIDISIRHHADPEDLNLRNSFHWANFREIADVEESGPFASFLGQESSYFMRSMKDRITDRLLHVAGRRAMEDPLGEVVRPDRRRFGRDEERIMSLFSHVRSASSTLFVHMHLLGTHGPMFKTARRVFSRGKVQREHWETDFYDDAILTFDNYVKTIVQGLKKRRLLRRSVIVIFSDHGQNFTVTERLPLIILFPNGEHGGRIAANVQNLDIAPTVLDYLGVEKPGWMDGLSLISSELEPDRLIFTADPRHRIVPDGKGQKVADRGIPKPPFYELQAMGVHCCQKYFDLDLETCVLTVSDTPGHTAPCDEGDLPDPQEVGRLIIDHLDRNGYDTSSLKENLPVYVSH